MVLFFLTNQTPVWFKQEYTYTVTSFISGHNFLLKRKNGQIVVQEHKDDINMQKRDYTFTFYFKMTFSP